MRIAILAALPEELAFFKKQSPSASFTIQPQDVVRWQNGSGSLLVACSGVGKVAAARTTTVLIERYTVRCILNVGTAGWLPPPPAPVLVLGERYQQADVDLTPFGYLPGQLPGGYPPYFSADPVLHARAQTSKRPGLSIQSGLICSTDQFISEKQRDDLINAFPTALAVDMESAACAQICYDYQLPFLSIRVPSDYADGQAVQRYQRSKGALAACQLAVLIAQTLNKTP